MTAPVIVSYGMKAAHEESAEPVSTRRIPVHDIMDAVAHHFDLTRDQLLAHTHQRAIARPRQIAMHLCRKLTRRSLPDLAKRFGGKHHTTILWANSRIEALIRHDEQVARDVAAIELRLMDCHPPADPVTTAALRNRALLGARLQEYERRPTLTSDEAAMLEGGKDALARDDVAAIAEVLARSDVHEAARVERYRNASLAAAAKRATK